jgi:hypothetical protein
MYYNFLYFCSYYLLTLETLILINSYFSIIVYQTLINLYYVCIKRMYKCVCACALGYVVVSAR